MDSAWTGLGVEDGEQGKPGAQEHQRMACIIPALAFGAGQGSGLLFPRF